MQPPAPTPQNTMRKRCSVNTANAPLTTASAASGCVSLTTTTDLSPLTRWAVGAAWAAVTTLALPSAVAALPAIGRLAVNTNQCSFVVPSVDRQPCFRIELTRKTDHVLRLRFIGQGEQKGQGRSLTFVALNPEQPVPILCDQGQCEVSAMRWQGSIVGVAEAFTTPLGIADGLPKAWPAQGRCLFEQRALTCTAEINTKEVFSAKGRL